MELEEEGSLPFLDTRVTELTKRKLDITVSKCYAVTLTCHRFLETNTPIRCTHTLAYAHTPLTFNL